MILSKTPLRISFVGGGTDLPLFYQKSPGKVLSTTINKYIYVIIKKSYDNRFILNYAKKEVVKNINDIENEYIREALKLTDIDVGVEITILSDIHSNGSGLGSSSSLIVGLLNSLYRYKGEPKDLDFLAAEACRIEMEVLGKPIGKQDQYAAAFGGLRLYTFHPDGSVENTRLNLKEIDSSILESCLHLVYTGLTRKSSDILENQNKRTVTNLQFLKKIASMPLKAAELLEKSEFDSFGNYLDTAWHLKKQLTHNISNDKIDFLYTKGLACGALGGKLLGAGGGGYILFYVPSKNIQEFIREYSKIAKILPFKFDAGGTRILLNEKN